MEEQELQALLDRLHKYEWTLTEIQKQVGIAEQALLSIECLCQDASVKEEDKEIWE